MRSTAREHRIWAVRVTLTVSPALGGALLRDRDAWEAQLRADLAGAGACGSSGSRSASRRPCPPRPSATPAMRWPRSEPPWRRSPPTRRAVASWSPASTSCVASWAATCPRWWTVRGPRRRGDRGAAARCRGAARRRPARDRLRCASANCAWSPTGICVTSSSTSRSRTQG